MKRLISTLLLIAAIIGTTTIWGLSIPTTIWEPPIPTSIQYDGWQIVAIIAALPAAAGAFSVKEFCELHRISVAFFYLLRARGEGPVEMRVGSRVLISREAAAEWRRAREVANAHPRDGPETAA